jgi:hypothetical protein
MFDTHKLTDKGFVEMAEYKNRMAQATKAVTEMMPEGRERSIFMTKVEEAVFWGAKAIASKAGNHSEVSSY